MTQSNPPHQPPITVLITGATDGIGQALARHYAGSILWQRPVRLVLIGRRPLDELDDPLYTPDSYCCVDLSQADCADQIAAWLDAHHIDTIDLLINNAGTGFVGPVTQQRAENIRQLVAVNLIAPIALTHRLLPRLDRGHGKLVYIGSVAAALPAPRYAVYAATKAALAGFVRNLQIELAATPETRAITAQIIHPGATRTGMHAKSGVTRAQVDWEKYPPAAAVAARIARAIGRRRRTTTIGWTNRILSWFGHNAVAPLDRLLRQGARRRYAHELSDTPAPLTTNQPRCVITGAADGIGRALAEQYASVGYHVTGVDVDEKRAAETEAALRAADAEVTFLTGDLSAEADRLRLQRQLVAGAPIGTLIHCAGISAVGPFAQMDLAQQLRVLEVNLIAPLLLTAELLRQDKVVPGGMLVFLASLSHFVGYPGAAIYAASKDGITAYARSLSVALAPHKIDVLTVFPGPTRTAHARRYSPDNSREHRRMAPEAVAEHIFDAVRARKTRLVPGWANRTFALIGHLAPRLTERIMRRTLFEKLPGAR